MSPPSSPSGSFYSPADYAPPNSMQYTLNSKIMVAAIIVLFVVVFFILGLHIYAKWFWRHSAMLSSRRNASWRRRHRLDFAPGQDPLVGYRSIGLDRAVIDSLPTFVYQPPSKQGTVTAAGEQQEEEEGPMECAVCLSEFQENETGRLLPACKHSFHTECIDMWFHSHSTCPLCRTIVSAPALLSPPPPEAGSNLPSPSIVGMQSHGAASTLEQQQQHHHHPDNPSSCPPSSIHHGSSMPYPSNVLFWGNHSGVLSQFSPPALASGSSSTRSLPHITIEIPPWRPEILASTPRSTSLSLSRLSSSDQACSSQPLKSPSIRASIKKLLSRERSGGRRIHPSSQEDPEHESDTTVEAV